MARRSILVAVAALIAAALPASADAATAPGALVLTSARWVSPATFSWTPGSDLLNVSQTVYRAPGTCAAPTEPAISVRVYPENTTAQHFAVPGDGTWCFFLRVTDTLGATADSPGLTIAIDTTNPTATLAVSNQAPGGVIHGVVHLSGPSTDAVSGVASRVFRVGVVGACATGIQVGANWNTAVVADGTYDVCSVVTDNAGHVGVAALTVIVANQPPPAPMPIPTPAPAPPAVAPATGTTLPAASTVAAAAVADKLSPGAPTKLTLVQPRAKSGSKFVALTLRWVNPGVADLDRIVVVLNLKRAPRSPTDGKIVHRGLGTSTTVQVPIGARGYLALFAYDHSGNVSTPARRSISLASLIPLRPLNGSVVHSFPRLTWEATDGTAYYNVQLFHKGKRMLVGWPSRPSFQITGKLPPGVYVWYVWPAVKRTKTAPPKYGALIGRATFVYEA